MHFYKYFTAMLLASVMTVSKVPVFAAETDTIVDTITLDESVAWNADVPADLGWKTAQDNGKWIEDLGIGADVSNLILVVNSLDYEDTEAMPTLSDWLEKVPANETSEKKSFLEPDGKSRMTYLSKNSEGEWNEIFSINCVISGGENLGKEAVYGSYRPEETFGVKENPGSLLPFRKLTTNDYWYLDPQNENYGEIVTVETLMDRPDGTIKLEGLKCYSNYGMILRSETEEAEIPALIVNCRQPEYHDDTLCGIQLEERYLCMLLQTLTEDSRIIVVGSLDELTGTSDTE